MYPQGFTVYTLSSLPCDVLDEIPFVLSHAVRAMVTTSKSSVLTYKTIVFTITTLTVECTSV